LIGDDDNNDRILENTMLIEVDFDVVDDCVVEAQINSINECFTLIIERSIAEALDKKGEPMKKNPYGESIRNKRS
jgi:hypothetical protein